MLKKTARWGDVLREVLGLGAIASKQIQMQMHLRRQVLRNLILLQPIPSVKQPVPSGWLIVELTEPSIFEDAWGAAQAISPEVRHCSSLGRLSDEPLPGGFVIVPRETGQTMWSLLLLANK